MKKNCQYCHKEFTKDYRTSRKHFLTITKYCSLRCKGLNSRGRIPHNKAQSSKTCETCKKVFMVPPSRSTAQFCSIKCHGVTRVGEKGINWQGGKTPLHKAIRNTEQYKLWRLAVFERDNFTCQHCGERGGKLEADHIKLFSKYPELRFDVSNGQTLCRPCHSVKTASDLKRHWVNQFSSYTLEAMN